MIQERIVISDANILFDLLSADLLDSFFELPIEVFTTDLVMHEVKTPEWRKRLELESRNKRIKVVGFSFEEMCEIANLMQQSGAGGLSFPDCSVLFLAEQFNGRLLTGDKHLRTFAEGRGVPVSGVLFLFDCLVERGILSPFEAAESLDFLRQTNPRLPNNDCTERLEKWGSRMK